jgi:hypothetical protein
MKFRSLVILVLANSLALVACGKRSSDEERIRALLDEAEVAAEARDVSDVLAFVADDYADSRGLDKAQLRDFLRGYFLLHPKIEIVVGIDGLQFPADGLAQADITVTSLSTDGSDREKLRVEFRRVGDDWRIARADRARQ